MKWLDALHGNCVYPRRLRVLSRHLSEIIPRAARVLDVGCGDGALSFMLGRSRPDLKIQGIEVLLRPEAMIQVASFDGKTIPFADSSFDVVMFVDVLHHTTDPAILLAEATRVARGAIAIKDHLLEGLMARSTLAFMDRVGNERHGVVLPFNYWTSAQWSAAFGKLNLRVQSWNSRLGLYPWPATWLFERSLHFVASLVSATPDGTGPGVKTSRILASQKTSDP